MNSFTHSSRQNTRAHPTSAIFKQAIIISVVIFGCALLAMVAIYTTTARHLENQIQALVEADLNGLSDLYATRRIIAVRQALERRSKVQHATSVIFLLLDKKGKKLAGNIKIWPKNLPNDNSWNVFSFPSQSVENIRYFGAGARLPGPFPLMIARSMAPRDAVLSQLRWTMVIALCTILIVGFALGYWLSRRMIGRLVAMNRICEAVEQGDMDARIKDGSADEFGALASHINRMLTRISALVAGTREISDRIAHELRTPLNRILLRIENVQDTQPPKLVATELGEINKDVRDTIDIFESLLDIATAESDAGDISALLPVDLAAILIEITELYSAVADEKNITITTHIEENAMILGDRNLLNRALANILDNAIKFSPAKSAIVITLIKGAHHQLDIRDSGPGLKPGMEERVFDRFYRGDLLTNIPGHGLGLAIVRAIAVRHGIKITLTGQGDGLLVRLICPSYQIRNQEDLDK